VTRWETLRSDVGGRHLGEAQAFLLFIPAVLAQSLFTRDDIDQPMVFGANLVANILSLLAIWGLLVLLRESLFRHRAHTPISPVVVVAAGAMLGLIKVLVTVWVAEAALGVNPWATFPLDRLVGGALTGAWFLPLATILLATRERFRLQRQTLVTELLARGDAGEPVRRDGGATHQVRLRRFLAQARAVIESEKSNPARLVKKVDRLIERRLRPLTKDLWAGSERRYTDFSISDLLSVLLSRQFFSPGISALVVAITTIPYVLAQAGFAEGMGRQILAGLLVWSVLTVLTMLPRSSVAWSAVSLGIATVVFTTANASLSSFLFGPLGDSSLVMVALANGERFLSTALIAGLFRTASLEYHGIRRELENVVGESFWHGELGKEHSRWLQREMAELLHGRIQNRLLSLVLSLRQQKDGPSVDVLLAELDLIEDKLLGTGTQAPADHTESLDEALSELAARWDGIIEVRVTMEGSGHVPPAQVETILRIAEEAVTNSVRHGRASSVLLEMTAHINGIDLVGVDDGVGPQGGPPGVGTLSLRRGAGQKWSLTAGANGQGSALRVHIPFLTPSASPPAQESA